MYSLVNANNNNYDLLRKYKLASILDYADNISEEELKIINNYVDENMKKDINNYKLIVINNEIIGCLLIKKFKDGYLLDEIFIEEKYRNKKIGSSIIKDLEQKYNIIYLWVYKNNRVAINLYKKYNFNVIDETESRYHMKYEVQ